LKKLKILACAVSFSMATMIAMSSTARAAGHAFSPVTVTCPTRAPKGCTVSVLVSSQFWDIDTGTAASAIVLFDAATLSLRAAAA
jgi:hypothetical protein